MKKMTLTTGIAAAVALASSVPSMAYYDGTLFTGGSAIEAHALSYIGDKGYCAASCITFAGLGSQNWQFWETPNQTPAMGGTAAPDHLICAPAPACPILNQVINRNYNPIANATGTGGSGSTVEVCDLMQAPNGKILSGHYVSQSVYNGTTFDVFYSLSLRKAVSMEGCTTPPTPAEAITSFSLVDPSTYAINSCVIASFANLNYHTCDTTLECGQFEKSIPVPAFAAATLGLGLVGLTYLSGRRRKIK